MYKFLLVVALVGLTACGGSMPIDEVVETTADSTAVVVDSTVVTDSTAK